MISTPFARASIAIVLLLVAAPDAARAWSPLGLDGGTVRSVAVDPVTPTTLYAAVFAGPDDGDGRGIYKSTDGGATWSRSSTGLEALAIAAIVLNPQHPATIYVGHYGGGFAHSTNGGASWTEGTTPFGSFTALVIDPVSPSTLYMAGEQGVYKSVNSGGTFSASNTGLTSLVTRALAVDPVNPAVLYVSTFDGVFKSTDGAASWSSSNTGLPTSGPTELVVDPSTPSTVYAGGCGFGVYRSVDGGATWSPNPSGLPSATPCVTAIAARPNVSGTLYLAALDDATQTVFKSTDSGVTWVPSGVGLEGHVVERLAADPTAGPNVYAGTQGGFFKSADGGATWSLSMSGIRHAAVQALTVDPNAPATLYAGGTADGHGSISKTTDGGVSWMQIGPRAHAPLASAALSDFVVWQMVVDPTNSSRVYVGTDGGVFSSTDGGATWTWGPTQGSGLVRWLAIDPFAPAVLYAGTYGAGLQKSTDGGATWTVTNNGLPTLYDVSVVPDPQHAGTVYASLAFRGVFKSVDGAASWTAVNNGFPNTFVPFGNLVMDPTDSDVLYVVASSPYRTGDGGASWTQTAATFGGYSLIIDPLTPTTLYAVSGDLVVDKTTDSGATSSSISPAGLPSIIQMIAIDPTTGSTLYAATFDGVFKSGTSTSVCASSADCNDGDLCTTDVCNPADPGADPGTGCLNTPVVCDTQCHSSPGSCDDQTGECTYSSLPFPDGTSCDDGDLCTFDRCIGGRCEGNPVPEPSCHAAGATRFIMRRSGSSDSSTLLWKWNRGATSFSDFANPIIISEYTLCVYDRSGAGGESAEVLRAEAPHGAVDCGGTPCWQITPKGFKYKDRSGSADGLTDIKLHAGALPKAKILVKGRGAGLELPAVALAPKVTVQLRRSGSPNPDCWGAEYQGFDIQQNDGAGFKAKTR